MRWAFANGFNTIVTADTISRDVYMVEVGR